MLPPDTVLQSRYRIIRQLGQGGMGAVYEAVDERLDSTVALKETLFADDRLRKQFEREARLLARMHHPALPRVSDHFGEGDGQFLIMQYIPGDDLAAMLAERRGPFPGDQVSVWADQLLDALDYLHTQDPQIIHRDIKPQNLKLTGRGQIILLDFGLAKGQTSEVSHVTTTASIFGYTPNYAPLEQIQGLGTDARSDIYALAATLYHLMTGVKPPDALTRAAALVNGQPDPLKPAHDVNNAVDSALSSVLQRAMAQNRELRYASAAEMRRAIKEGSSATMISTGEAKTELYPPAAPAITHLRKPETRTALSQATIQSGAPAETLAGARAGVQAGETTIVRQPQASKNSQARWAIAGLAVLLLAATVGGFYVYQRRNNSAAIPTSNAPASPSVNQGEPVNSVPTKSESSGAGDTVNESKQIETESRVTTNERAARKKEQTGTQKERAERRPEPRTSAETGEHAEGQGHPQRVQPITPTVPEEVRPDVPRMGGGRGVRRVDGVTIRDFPNGGQLIITPDGTRVRVRPDGSRQVLNPGGRVDRRRNRPRP